MHVNIDYTVNAGLCIATDEESLLIDVLHRKETGFSPAPQALLNRMAAHSDLFSRKLHLAFTHLHGDHFDSALVRRFLAEYPETDFYGPGLEHAVTGSPAAAARTQTVDLGSFHLAAFETIHDGKPFADQPHLSFCIKVQGQTFVICGDATLEPELADRIFSVCPGTVDAVFLNVYQLASVSGGAFLKKLQPKQIFLYHLPFSEDDVYGFHKIAGKIVAQKAPEVPAPVEILEPMQRVPLFSSESLR